MTQRLLTMKNIHIQGKSDEQWVDIIKGRRFTSQSRRGFGLIGESGAGKSTLGLAAMGFCRDGCVISAGSVHFDGKDLLALNREDLRQLRGNRIAYVAQSAAASFNPAHKLIDQFCEAPLLHSVMERKEAEAYALKLYNASICRFLRCSACATPMRFRAGSYNGR